MTNGIGGASATGAFQLRFSTEPAAFTAARECRSRGFVVDVIRVSQDRWVADARARSIVPAGEFERYASRLRRIAAAFDGTYVGFTPD